ncbi:MULTISPECIES: OmpA family protein [unclassified Neisseria]|uniref:OmpA family protein n=1 Tax=unclassified Neisseria TaxID=2623750 RepID=UPI001071DAD4|nr:MULTISPECIES: OmpA family protein [unclassified Neisseria]MBF0804337.1 OmpA family protein [Neisseria sp. 19428wB4_WF04]TFU42913.1 OmpA family protein [Neisseria sp. WF04]
MNATTAFSLFAAVALCACNPQSSGSQAPAAAASAQNTQAETPPPASVPAQAAPAQQAQPASSALQTAEPQPAAAQTISAPVSSVSAQGSNLSATGSSLSAQQTGFNIEINLASDVLFDFDKADLKPEADAELQKAAEVIREKGKGLILITGHTDSKGSRAYNKKLSLARAEAVKQWLEKHGLHYDYQTDGKGAADPIAPNTNEDGNDNPEGRVKNRRVEIVINKTKRLGK